MHACNKTDMEQKSITSFLGAGTKRARLSDDQQTKKRKTTGDDVLPIPMLLDAKSSIMYIPGFLSRERSASLFEELRPGPDCPIRWERHRMRTPAGQLVPLPRKTALLSATRVGETYNYSGTVNVAQRMPDSVLQLSREISERLDIEYDVVFLNWYVNGKESHIGWHADDERLLVPDSGITSVSLGQTRKFQVLDKREGKRIGATKKEKQAKIKAGKLFEFDLASGDLLAMLGSGFQEGWLHRVPKEASRTGARINLTFRKLF